MLKVRLIIGMIVIVALTSCTSDKKILSDKYICKAGISTIMSKDVKIINIGKEINQIIYLSYTRLNDNKLFSYKCEIKNDKIIWGVEDGRWRTSPYDSKTSFIIQENKIIITDKFDDGSKKVNEFKLAELK